MATMFEMTHIDTIGTAANINGSSPTVQQQRAIQDVLDGNPALAELRGARVLDGPHRSNRSRWDRPQRR